MTVSKTSISDLNAHSPSVENGGTLLPISVVDLVDKQAKLNPNGIAAEFQDESISYSQLRDASIRVALKLKERGFKPRDHVPLLTTMGLEMVVAILGVLRLGACYCPIDLNAWSSSRVTATLKAVQSNLVFSTVDITLADYEVMQVPDILKPVPSEITPSAIKELEVIRRDLRVSDLIYIIFTSGTTGKPKGVMVPHGSAVHLVQQKSPVAMTMYPGARVLLFFSIAFDGCAGVVFSSLCHGGTLAMASSADVLEVAPSCSTLVVTPSILTTFDPSPRFDGVREIYMGGEAPTEALIEAWTTPTRKLYNCYGPTECTTAVSVAEMSPGGPIILGNLVTGVELLLLDENLDCEVDEGEICIRGPCLAIGYLRNEKLTREKFFMRNGIRHYRTGDLARRSKDGLHFVARVDRLVKNRGFLINLETEVEPALLSFPSVNRAVAFMHLGALVGFVTPANIPIRDLQDFLKDAYDHFQVPDLLFAVDDFPLTSNGKVDTKGLRDTLSEADADDSFGIENVDSFHSSIITSVTEAFATVFDRSVITITPKTSFGKLGGNSLRAIRLASFLRHKLLSISVGDIFALDTVAAIGRALLPINSSLDAQQNALSVVSPVVPLTDHQIALLQETRDDPSSNYMFHSMTRETTPNGLTPSLLREGWECIFKRHSIFRTTFDLELGSQTVQDSIQLQWKEYTVSTPEELKVVSEQERLALWAKLRSPADPTSLLGPQFWIVEIPGQKIQINSVIHHIYMDAWSFGILLVDLEEVIGNKKRHSSTPSFASLAQFLAAKKIQERDKVHRFWEQYSTHWSQLQYVKLSAPYAPSTEPWSIWESDTGVKKSTLDQFASSAGISSAACIFTAWALLLSQYTSSSTVGMKISVSGRNLDFPSVDSIVGPLNGRCPFIATIDENSSILTTAVSLHQNFYRVNEFQWSYPELRRQIGPQENKYSFDSQIVVLLDMPVEPGPWKVVETQKPTAPLWLGVAQKGETIDLRLRYDGSRYSAEGIQQMAQSFIAGLKALVDSGEDTLVRDITRVMGPMC